MDWILHPDLIPRQEAESNPQDSSILPLGDAVPSRTSPQPLSVTERGFRPPSVPREGRLGGWVLGRRRIKTGILAHQVGAEGPVADLPRQPSGGLLTDNRKTLVESLEGPGHV